MGNDFTKQECQHLLLIMNGYSDARCELCSRIRQKLQARIAEMPDDEPEFFPMGDEDYP